MAVGDPARHPFWRARVDGSARYTGDVDRPGMLHGALVRSPWPSARIRSISIDEALAADGVVAVLTAADLPARRYQDYGIADRTLLADDRVRYVGEQVAIVLAESEDAARRATSLVRVRYRRTRPVLTARDARSDGAPSLHDQASGNVALSVTREHGAVDAGLAEARRTVRGRYRYPRQAHACMEPSVVLADVDPERDGVQVWTPTQAARNIQRELAQLLGLEIEQVRVHETAVGGDFGSRVRASDIEAVAAAAALRLRRPVRIQLSRAEEFAHTKHRFDFEIDVMSGLDAAGAVVARDAEVVVDCGGYAHAGGNELVQATGLLTAQYDVPAVRATGAAVYTNTRPGGSFRGAGIPQAVFALESHVDEVADALAADPAALRRSWFNRPGSVTPNGWEIDSLAFDECLDAVLAALDWDRARSTAGTGRGVGIAAALHVTGAIVSEISSTASARASLRADGTVTISTGASDPGTGQSLVAAQMVATELGVPVTDVDVETMDTATTPPDPGAGASRGTYTTGRAAAAAARLLATALRQAAGDKLGVPPGDVRLEDGEARAGADAVDLGSLVALAPDAVDGVLGYDATITAEIPINTAPAAGGNIAPSYACAVHGVEVDVDRGTGVVRVLRVVAAHDSGTIVNPVQAEGQVVGGVVMALGAALGEDLLLEGGRVVNPSYVDYAVPRSADVPPIEVIFVGGPDARGPHGAKGLAEIALSPTAPAVANAVAHATGHRFRRLPLTPDVVLAELAPVARTSVLRRPARWWVAGVRWSYPRGLHRLLGALTALLHETPSSRSRRQRRETAPRVEAVASVAALVSELEDDPRAVVLGGGTDLLSTQQQGLLDADRLLLLAPPRRADRGVAGTQEGDLDIGAAVTLAELADAGAGSELPALRMLADVVATIASPQVRNVATVAGNLLQEKRCWFFRNGFDCYKRAGALAPCYAIEGDHRFFHAVQDAHRCQAVTPSDLAGALAVLDARVEVHSSAGARWIAVADLHTGPGESVLGSGDVVTRIRLPRASLARLAASEKLALGSGGFAVAAVFVSTDVRRDADGVRLVAPRVVLGGVSPTPVRALGVEALLDGRVAAAPPSSAIAAAWEGGTHPLRDNGWKVTATTALIERALVRIIGEARSR